MSYEFGQLNRNLSSERDMRTPFDSKSPQFSKQKNFQFSKISPFQSTSKFTTENYGLIPNIYPQKNLNKYNMNNENIFRPKTQTSPHVLIRDIKEKNIKSILDHLKNFEFISYKYDKDFGLIIRFSNDENAFRFIANGPRSIHDIYNNEAIILNTQFFFIEDEYEDNYGKYGRGTNKNLFTYTKRSLNKSYSNSNESYIEKSLFRIFLDVFLNR